MNFPFMNLPFHGVLGCTLALAALLWGGTAATTHASPGDAQDKRCKQMLEDLLRKPYPEEGPWRHVGFALAGYWLDKRTDEADAAILKLRDEEFPARIKTNQFHWQAYQLERIYFLFGKNSKHHPGRIGKEAEAALLDMLWQWAAPSCRLSMTLPEHDWWFWNSENHHGQAWTGFWGAAHIFADHPDYKHRTYDDGTTPAEMARAFDDYYKRFARERAAKGLLVEINSNYNKYTLGGWYNIYDFAKDPELRRRMGMLLDLFWADWAIEQIDGIRGGSRHRCYPGDDSVQGASVRGGGWFHFGLPVDTAKHPGYWCAATTFWRPSPVVATLAQDTPGRGVYEYTSRRPGRALARTPGAPAPSYIDDPNHPMAKEWRTNVFDPAGGDLLRYTYCTPDFVMGTSMMPPLSHEAWVAMSSQNHWDGVIFGGHPTARIFVQPLQPKKGSFYNASWSAQRHGSLILQRLKKANHAKGQRIWFDKALTRTERDGWVFAEGPRAYAAVRVVDGGTEWEPDTLDQYREGEAPKGLGEWLKCVDPFSPVIIEVARKSDYPDLDAFAAAVLALPLAFENKVLSHTGLAGDRFTFYADYRQPPEIDGKPVDYAPDRVYDCPFIQSDWDSGVVTLRAGARQVVHDFNKP